MTPIRPGRAAGDGFPLFSQETLPNSFLPFPFFHFVIYTFYQDNFSSSG